MAQWNALKELVTSQKIKGTALNCIYTRRMNFPVLFRGQYANWIESQEWPAECTEELARKRFEEFVDILNNDLAQMGPAMESIDFRSSVENFVENFEGRYTNFVHVIHTIMKSENTLILSCQESASVDDDRRLNIAQENPDITKQINNLRSKLRATDLGLNKLEESQEKDWIMIQDLHGKRKQQEHLLQSDPEAKNRLLKFNNDLATCQKQLYQRRMDMKTTVFEACQNLTQLLGLYWAEIESWKQDQRLACTMLRKPKDQIMEVLDKLGENVGEVFTNVVLQIGKFINILQKVNFQDDTVLKGIRDTLHPELMTVLKQHLDHIFIVDKNITKQVLKVTNGKSLGFPMSVRFLGGHAFGLDRTQPKVSASLYPEKQLKEVLEATKHIDGCCKIQNGENKTFEFLRAGNCIANFNNMVVSSVKRDGRGKNDDFVTDYKHAFIFRMTVKITTGQESHESFNLKAVSLPIVITSQTSQECMARGTIIWSTAFLKPEKERSLPFEAEEEVQWTRFSEVINALFKEYTGKGLTKEHLNYLAKIAFRESRNLDFDKLSISRQAVLKEKLTKRDFPFWKWLMSCLNSVKDTLISEWKEGLIYGFISKEEAEHKLKDHASGTFLIRFSESNIEHGQRADIHGYLTVAVAEVNPNNGKKTVFHVKESLTPKDLSEKNLAPILEAYETDDYNNGMPAQNKKLLCQLWTPTALIPFEDAFGKHIKQKEAQNDGYNRGRYLIKIYLADSNSRGVDRNGATAADRNRNWPLSPASTIDPVPSPAASELFSDFGGPGSPGSDWGPVPMLQQQQQPINLPQAPITANQTVCAVAPRQAEPTLNEHNNGFITSPGTGMYQMPQTVTGEDGTAFTDELLSGMSMDALTAVITSMANPSVLTVDMDNDVMLNPTAQVAPQLTTLAPAPQNQTFHYAQPDHVQNNTLMQN